MQIQDYITPPGATDFPFIYLYDGSALTDGLNYHDIPLQLQGD